MTAEARRRLLADLALVGIAAVWGGTFVLVKEALESASTILFLALRFSLAALAMALLFRRGLRRLDRRALRAGAAVGLMLFLGYLFQTLGLRWTTPTKSAFITGLYVVLVPLLSAAIYRTRMSLACWTGVALAMTGLYLLAAPPGRWEIGSGDLLTLLCAVAFAFHILLLGRFSRVAQASTLATLQIATAAVLGLAIFGWAEEPFLRWSPALVAAIGFTSLAATALAFYVQTWAQRFTSPAHAALIFSLEPVFAWGTSYLILNEVLAERAVWGAVLILGGVLLSEMKPS